MIAECKCQQDRGTCCAGCRSAVELMLVAVRLEKTAPQFSERVRALANELQKALVINRGKLN